MSGDDFKTPSDGVWGELSRLHRRWGTPTLGASMFFSFFFSFILFIVAVADS